MVEFPIPLLNWIWFAFRLWKTVYDRCTLKTIYFIRDWLPLQRKRKFPSFSRSNLFNLKKRGEFTFEMEMVNRDWLEKTRTEEWISVGRRLSAFTLVIIYRIKKQTSSFMFWPLYFVHLRIASWKIWMYSTWPGDEWKILYYSKLDKNTQDCIFSVYGIGKG